MKLKVDCSLRVPLWYAIITTLILVSTTSFGQLFQKGRFERPQKNSDDYYNVISLKEEGLALFRERDKYKASNQIWELILLDTAMQEKSTIELQVNSRYKMVGYEI